MKEHLQIIIFVPLFLVTLMTASRIDEIAPSLSRAIRLAGHFATTGTAAIALLSTLNEPRESLRSFYQSSRITLLPTLILFFLGW